MGDMDAGFENDVPHFDHQGHFRTQQQYEQRRRKRMAEQFVPVKEGAGPWANFFFVSGILTIAFGLPSVVIAAIAQPGRRDPRD